MKVISRLNQYDVTDTNYVRQVLNLLKDCSNYERRLAKKTGQWRAVINIKGIVTDLGLFDKEAEALKRYWYEYHKQVLLKEEKKGYKDISIGELHLQDVK